MAEEKKELSEKEISERTGFGEPTNTGESEEDNEEETEENSKEKSEEESSEESEEDKEETQTSEKSDEDDESTEESEDSSEDEEEESEEKSESEEDDEDDKEEESSSKEKRTVPYNKLKTERTKRKAAEKKLTDFLENFDDKIGTAVKTALKDIGDKKEEDQPDEAEKAAEELAEELGLDKEGLAKVLRKAVELSGKGQISPELKKRLEKLDELTEDQEKNKKKEKDAQAIVKFDKEWDVLVPILKKRFPNAGDDELVAAKKVMDDLAHSKKYHLMSDLDYIFFKNKKKFRTILKVAKNSKSGEQGKAIREEGEPQEEEGDNIIPIEELTPEVIKRRDKEDIALNKSAKKDYTIIEPL